MGCGRNIWRVIVIHLLKLKSLKSPVQSRYIRSNFRGIKWCGYQDMIGLSVADLLLADEGPPSALGVKSMLLL